MKKKTTYILLTLLIVGGIIGVLIMNKRSTAEKTKMVANVSTDVAAKIMVVSDSLYSSTFTSTGLLQASTELPVISNIAGQVVRIYVKEGDQVRAGKVLLQVENELLRSDAQSSKATYDALRKDYERFEKAYAQGGVTAQQLDNIRTQLVAAESRYTSSKRRLSDSSLKAPISGKINKKYVEVGSLLSPGAKLFDIIDDSALKVLCYANEKQVLGLKEGQEVSIRCDNFPGQHFAGRISFVSTRADRSLNFPVEVTLVGEKDQLKSGMIVLVSFNSDSSKEGMLIPRRAIDGSVQAANVYVVENGVARKKEVVVGQMVGEQIEVLSGLQSGDSIVVSGLINITDGTRVRNIKE